MGHSFSRTRSGSCSKHSGVYSWLMVLKYSQILLEDSRAVRLSSTCWGREKVDWGWSPGRAVKRFTCFSQLLFLAATCSVCLLRNLDVASLSFAFSSFLSSLYLALFPFFTYSLFFLLLACLTATELILPSRLVNLTDWGGQWVSSWKVGEI